MTALTLLLLAALVVLGFQVERQRRKILKLETMLRGMPKQVASSARNGPAS
jgi:hypothetical protein